MRSPLLRRLEQGMWAFTICLLAFMTGAWMRAWVADAQVGRTGPPPQRIYYRGGPAVRVRDGGHGARDTIRARRNLGIAGRMQNETITGLWTFTGNPAFTGNPTFTGAPVFSGTAFFDDDGLFIRNEADTSKRIRFAAVSVPAESIAYLHPTMSGTMVVAEGSYTWPAAQVHTNTVDIQTPGQISISTGTFAATSSAAAIQIDDQLRITSDDTDDFGIDASHLTADRTYFAPDTGGTFAIQGSLDESELDHGGLAGLSDDDHPQYPTLTGTEDITGTYSFVAGTKLVLKDDGDPTKTLKIDLDNFITGTDYQGEIPAPDGVGFTFLLRDETQTVGGKSISMGGNTITGTLAQFNTAVTDASLASLAGSETLTNKTVALGSNTISGTTAQFNTALSDGSFATLAGSETLTNKTIDDADNTLTVLETSITDGALLARNAADETIAGDWTFTPGLIVTEAADHPATPAAGVSQIWSHSDDHTLTHTGETGLDILLGGPIFRQTATATVGNTTTQATIVGTGVGTLTIPADHLVVGSTIRVTLEAEIAKTSGLFKCQVLLGGLVISDTGFKNITATSSGNGTFILNILATVYTAGASGSIQAPGKITYHTAALTDVPIELADQTQLVDTTAANAVDVQVDWSTANAGNTITSYVTLVEVF